MTAAFPEDLWSRCGVPEEARFQGLLPSLLVEIETRYGAPRGDERLLTAFVRDILPPGRYLIYGAGLHSRGLLPLLAQRKDIEVCGVLDRMADSLRSFEGLPVFAPEAAPRLAGDYILVSHGSYESEMIETLLAHGTPRRRIVPIYTNPAFRRLCRDFFAERIRPALPGGIDALVVTCFHLSLASERQIARLFPQDRTLHVYFGRPDAAGGLAGYPTIDLHESLDALAALIERLRPRAIYLSTVIYKNFLGFFIKARFPDIVLIHEIYDFTLCWLDRDLEALFGLNAWTTRLLRLAEFYSGQCADLVVSKRGGADWDAIWSRCRAPYRLLFPMLDAAAAGTEAAGPRPPAGDLVYAGFLPSRAFLETFTNGYAFLPTLAMVCANGGLTADIYNAAHAPGAGDAIFKDYREAFAEGPVRYHARLPYDELVGRLPSYSYGWLWDPQDDTHPDRAVGVCNRWTGYLSGGLPTILDPEWRFMADLVRRHGAGIVVGSRDPDDLVAAIRGHDRDALAAGAAALKRELLRWNDVTLDVVAGTVDAALAAKR